MWWRFLQAVRTGEHKLAPMTWLAAAGAAIYTLWPLDIIPDLLLPFGIVDDLSLWGMVLVLATREKQRWEASFGDGAVDV